MALKVKGGFGRRPRVKLGGGRARGVWFSN